MRTGPPQDAPLSGLTVLVVEDEFLIAMNLASMLELCGARVIGPAATAVEALRLLETARPDAALLDVHLKGGLVTPVVEALRDRHIPYALTTAYSPSDLATLGVLADAPIVGKITHERDLVLVLTRATGG